MPVFEMPLEQLEIYEGRNPRPVDFDSYWERALAEMRAWTRASNWRPRPFRRLLPNVSTCFLPVSAGRGFTRSICGPRTVRGNTPQ